MWLYRYLYRRVATAPDAATQGGKAFDDALNWRYRKLGRAPVDAPTEAEMLAIIDKAYEGVELPLEEHRTPARYKEVVQAYNQHYKAEHWDVLGVQVPGAVVLGELDAPFAFWRRCLSPADYNNAKDIPGRKVQVVFQFLIDMFVHIEDHYFVVDTKTSKDGDPGKNSYSNAPQMKGYCFALQELARLHPGLGLPATVNGAIINHVVIRLPYKNPERKPGASDKPRNEFYRSCPTFYTQECLEEWRQDTLYHVKQMLGWVADDHFPASEGHCSFYVGAANVNYGHYGKDCPYLGVCRMPAAQRALGLSTDEFMDYGRGPLAALIKGEGAAAPVKKATV